MILTINLKFFSIQTILEHFQHSWSALFAMIALPAVQQLHSHLFTMLFCSLINLPPAMLDTIKQYFFRCCETSCNDGWSLIITYWYLLSKDNSCFNIACKPQQKPNTEKPTSVLRAVISSIWFISMFIWQLMSNSSSLRDELSCDSENSHIYWIHILSFIFWSFLLCPSFSKGWELGQRQIN